MTEKDKDGELLALAERTAVLAGEDLVRRYGHVRGLETKSSATDPVSDADRAAEQLIVDALLSARPNDGIVAEEGGARPTESGLTWVIDPLDGTVNYLYQLGGWGICIAAEDAEGTVCGVVHEPLTHRTFTAVRGRGAWLDGTPLHVNDPVPISEALLATGFAYLPERRARQAALVARMLPHVRDIRRLGSSALDVCFVAAGSIDAYLEEYTNHWDRAAAVLIASEAGAIVTTATPTGAEMGILVAGPNLHRELTDLLFAVGEHPPGAVAAIGVSQ
jgi:myo-inositol-1(or 4)-monophosphatase